MGEPKLGRDYRSYYQSSDELYLAYRREDTDFATVNALPSARAYRVLQVGFVALPLVSGLDKFANQLVDWTIYLGSAIPHALTVGPQAFLYLVGIWEIFLALGIALKPRVFGDVLAFWLVLVACNLVAQGQFFDIALSNFGLAAAACALARLSGAQGDPL